MIAAQELCPVETPASTTRFGSQMNNRVLALTFSALFLALPGPVNSDQQTYREAFRAEVIEFANLNRLNIARLHRDVHVDCYIPVTIATTILRDGSVKDVAVAL